MFNWFKKKRIYCIANVAVPQIYTKYGWRGLSKEGLTFNDMDYQIKYCALPTAQEAEDFLRTINIIYPKGL